MRILVTGACGFVGHYLALELLAGHHDVVLVTRDKHELTLSGRTHKSYPCDIADSGQVEALIAKFQPEAVVHLAGLAHVVEGAKNRQRLSLTNTVGVHNLCAAIESAAKEKVQLLFASTALVYGSDHKGQVVVDESTPPQPNSPYGSSKLAAEYIGRTFESDRLSFYVARPFNHIGPGQAPNFVCSGFAKRIFDASTDGVIEVGNLSARRDFCDVRDVVRAYRLILERRPAQKLFVLGSGRSVPIGDMFEALVQISGKRVVSRINPEYYRPDESFYLEAGTQLAKSVLGWHCEIPLSKSLTDIYQALQQ